MKKLLLLIITTCIASLGAWGQTSSVSATITDSTSQAYANGTYDILFRPAPGVPGTPTRSGSAFTQHFSGVLDASGAFAVTLTRNDFVQPAGSQWTFTICPLAASACFTSNQTIAAASVNLTSALHTLTPIVSVFSLGNIPAAYSSSEIVITPNPGSFFWNLTTGTFNFWNGSSWTAMIVPTSNITFSGNNIFTGSNTFCLIDGAYIAASTCYPTTQLAITAAGTTGMVEIPPSVSLTDSYQNNNNIPVLDWRGGIEGPRIWSQIGTSHNVKDPTGVVIPDGNDIVLVSRGAADVHLKNIPEDVTSTTTVVGAGTVTITVSNCNTGVGGNWYAGAGLNIEPPPGASSNYEFIASGSWSCLSSTQLSATFAKAHTQPFHIRQQGVLFLDGYAMKPSPDPGSVLQFYSISDANGNVAIYLPLTNGAFPANAPSLSAVFTGANGLNNNINFRNNGASSQFLLSNSANTFNLVSIDDNGNDIRNGTAGGLFIKNSGTQVCALQNSGGTGLMTCDIWRMNGNAASVGNIRLTSGGTFNFRNNANNADVSLAKDTSDRLTFGGQIVADGSHANTLTIGTGNVTTAGTAVTNGTCQAQTGITVTGTAVTDGVTANLGTALPATWQTGIVLSAHPTATNTVTVYLCNPTAGSITPAATQVNVRVTR